MAEGTRVLHVVQKFSSGVGSAIAQYTRSVPELEHHLVSGTPVDAEGDLADHGDFASVHRMDGSHLSRIRRVRELVAELRPDVVHAHSSHGGAYARLAVSRWRTPLVYTPHCYAFERRDVAFAVRAAFWAVEALLAVNTSAVAACSAREARLSRMPLRRPPRWVVPNIAPAHRPDRPGRQGTERLVVGGGRLSPQKDPAFFLAVVRRLRAARPGLRAVWLGDGDPARRAALEAEGVEVTGWLPRDATLKTLSAADLYLHSARWEGFPLMVAEAAALEVPTLVRRLPCFVDVPLALTLDPDPHAPPPLALLDDGAAAATNVLAWAEALGGHTAAAQRAALLAVYSAQNSAR
ncbi:glycosyltransferase family 4 protein [Blastococcus sp. CCUG 61487]|uniref:glycosyltransferase family 4 protein n=1 Tax=Blastococcus sp. CCUG 61487 TaxID=1840703 RepID=UPI001485091D|nr:glycosyltransferase family 4 protein [Blastococcus sp. CCUG 61487]